MPFTVLVRNPVAGAGASPALTFDGDRIVLGRGAFADVRLPDPSVSARHATVRATGGEYLLFDEGSTNGTFVGGVRLAPQAPRTLRTGDLIRLGRVWIEVRTDAAPLTQDLPLATRELAFQLVEGAMHAMGDEVAPSISVVEGPDRGQTLSLALEGHVYLIGRGETCSLLLTDADASREHVQIVRRAGGVLVQDLGGKNRATLGDAWAPADRAVVWKRPAMLCIGRSVIALTEPVADVLAELEAAADEALPADGAPPPPPPSMQELAQQSSRPDALLPGPSGGSAPVAVEVPKAPRRAKSGRASSGWSATDLAVGAAALLVILLSAAGLYWLLKP